MSVITAPDIEETILVALQQMFQLELITKAIGDPLALRTLHMSPLQDDPTLAAPYLTYGPDSEKGVRPMTHEECKQYGDTEIGGPVRFLRYYSALCGTPIVTTREAAHAAINNLLTRVVRALITYYDLSGIVAQGTLQSPDQSERLEGANYYLIDGTHSTLEGGEQTWFGKGYVHWHYPVSWYVPTRVYIGP